MSTFRTPIKPLILAMAAASAQAYTCDSPFIVDTLDNDANDNKLSITEALIEVSNCPSDSPLTIQISDILEGSTIELANSINLDGLKTVSVEGPTGKVVVTNSVLATPFISVAESSHLTLKNIEFDGQNNARTQALVKASGNTSSLTLDNVTIKNVTANQNAAGPLYIDHAVANIKNSEIKSNTALGTIRSAGIYSVAGILDIEDTVFDSNVSETDNTTPSGGGIYHTFSEFSLGQVDIKGSEFKNNRARNYGGAISVNGAASLNITDTVFDNNRVTAASNEAGTGSNAEAHGGAIAIQQATPTNIIGSTFSDNQATNYGGALYIKTSAGTQVSITDTTFDGNQAQYSESEATLGHGGGIYVDAGVDTTLSIDRSTLSNNEAYGRGGALYVASGELTLNITSSTISGNTAYTGAAISMTDGLTDGAGSHISHSSIINNSANDIAHTIGAIRGDGNPHLTISHSIIANNFGNTGQLCVSESSTAYVIDHSIIDNADADPTTGCVVNTDNGGNQFGTADNMVDPMLEELADNGGATKTHYLNINSPAIDTGNANILNEPDSDQRGNDRIMRGAIDIGAVEYGNLAPTLTGLEFVDPAFTNGDDVNIDASGFFTDQEGDSLSFTATGLPMGTSISDEGVISGVINDSGTFEIRIRAEDAYGAYTEVDIALVISALPVHKSDDLLGSINPWFVALLSLLSIFRLKKRTEA